MFTKIDNIRGKPAEEIEKQMTELLGDGQYLLFWKGDTGVPRMNMAIMTNMDTPERLKAIISYVSQQFQTAEGMPPVLANIFEAAAVGALSDILRRRAVDMADKVQETPLSGTFFGGAGDAN